MLGVSLLSHRPSLVSRTGNGTLTLPGTWPLAMPGRGSGALQVTSKE